LISAQWWRKWCDYANFCAENNVYSVQSSANRDANPNETPSFTVYEKPSLIINE